MLQNTHNRTSPKSSVTKGLQIFLITGALLLIFDSAKLRSAMRDLPANPVTDTLVMSIDRWHGWMQQIGTAQVIEFIRIPFTELHSLKWMPEEENSGVAEGKDTSQSNGSS